MDVVDDDYDGWLARARRLLAEGGDAASLAEATAACNRAIASRPDAAEGWIVKCQLASALDDDAGALAAAEMAVARAPRRAEAHFWRAAVLGDLGLLDAGLAAVDQAMALLGDDDGWLLEDLFFEKAAMLEARRGAGAGAETVAGAVADDERLDPAFGRPEAAAHAVAPPALTVLRGGAR